MNPVRTSSIANAVSITLLAAYPPVVYLLLDQGDLRLAGAALLVAVGLRAFLPGSAQLQTMATLGVGVLFAAALAISSSEELARLYPVAVSTALLAVFGATLMRPPSMVERFARGSGAEVDADGTRYTRLLTIVWCGFFLVNACIALATALLASREAWALYNGFLSYIVAGTLFVGERIARPSLRQRVAQSAPR